MKNKNIKYYFGPKHKRWDPIEDRENIHPATDYFGRVLTNMETYINNVPESLHIYVTSNIDRIPECGKNVISIVIGDEYGRPPLYSSNIGAVFKCYGTRPNSEISQISLDRMTLSEITKTFKNVYEYLPYKIRSSIKKIGKKESRRKNIYEIPLGYQQQEDKNIKKMADRSIDIFFAGTFNKKFDYNNTVKRYMGTPKDISRKSLTNKVKNMSDKRNKWDFVYKIKNYNKGGKPFGKKEYSNKMANSRICLCPRGNNLETWRVFEAARYGCVIITEKLPKRWYYKNAPIISIDRWSRLEETLERILESRNSLQSRQEKVLGWWRNTCSGSAIGKFMADRINSLFS